MKSPPENWRRRIANAIRRADRAGEVLDLPEALLRRAARFRVGGPLIVAVGVAIVFAIESGHRRLEGSFQQLRGAYEAQAAVRLLAMAALGAETGQRGYMLTGKATYLEPYKAARQRMPDLLAQIRSTAIIDPVADTLIQQIEVQLIDKLRELDAAIALIEKGQDAEALRLTNAGVGKRRMDSLRASIDELQAHEQSLIEMRTEEWRINRERLRATIIGAVVVSIVLLLAMLRKIRRDMGREHDELLRLDRLVAERTEEITELASHLQTAREEEKAALARELHDELGAILTATRMDIAWVRRRGGQLPEGTDAKLVRALGYLDEGIALKRRIIEGMVPSALTNLGLVSALETLIEEFRSSGERTVTCELPDDTLRLPHEHSIAIYRIVQEALTNIQKHAQAKRVSLTLRRTGDRLLLRIEDDGVGINAATPPLRNTHGVRGMRQRMIALRGHLDVQSTPGRGTTVEATLPIGAEQPPPGDGSSG